MLRQAAAMVTVDTRRGVQFEHTPDLCGWEQGRSVPVTRQGINAGAHLLRPLRREGALHLRGK